MIQGSENIAKALGKDDNKQGASALLRLLGVKQRPIDGGYLAYSLSEEKLEKLKIKLEEIREILNTKK